MLTGMKRLLVPLFTVAATLVALVLPGHLSAADAKQPRVMAIHYSTDVNPVTQDWLNSKLTQAAKDGYAAAVIVRVGGRGARRKRQKERETRRSPLTQPTMGRGGEEVD